MTSMLTLQSRTRLFLSAPSLLSRALSTMSTSNKPNPSVILIGVPLDYATVPNADKLKTTLKNAADDAAAAGVDIQVCHIPPEGGLPQLVKALQSKQWDAVQVGHGVRSNMALTPFFEQIIAAQVEHAPQARLIFNTGPGDILPPIQRWFTNLKK